MENVIELTQVTYDQKKLQKWYLEVKKHTVDKGLFVYQTQQWSTPPDYKWNGRRLNNDVLKESSYSNEYADCGEIKELYELFNFKERPSCALVIYEPNFIFDPHKDDGRTSYIAFPIFPDDGGVGIDFYSTEVLSEDEKIIWLDKHDDKYSIGQHKYSTKHPTLINVEKPHGCRNDNRNRVYLQIDVYEKFNSIKQRIKDGIFFT
jgi:hypothetical protein